MIDIQKDNLNRVNEVTFIPWNDLQGKTVFITGATGLVGSALVKSLCLINQEQNLDIHLILLVRNIQKAKDQFETIKGKNTINIIEGDVTGEINVSEPIDYIVHCASQTASREFVEHAVETIQTTVYGADHVLRLAREKNVKSIVFLSSMEVYGYPEKGHLVSEEEIGTFSPLNLRNSYPISKIMGEMLCFSYTQQYGVPAKIVRLTQIVGTDVQDADQRFSAYLLRCAVKKKDIVLKSKGESERSYLYIADAVTAILTVLLKGENGKAYNAADEKTYCSISEIASSIAKEYGLKIVYDVQKESANSYLDTLYMNLNIKALRKLGWRPLDEII